METLAPGSEAQLAEVVNAALSNKTPLEVAGGRTRNGIGRPVLLEKRVSTSGLTGVTLYEPSELVMIARSGTTVGEITNLLDQNGQELAFEPFDPGPVYGSESLSGTIGGLVATNACGPRRIKAGAARDHVLGFRAVSGRGDIFQSGGRVMKNVTGYDLSKLITGSYGTLGILSEITIKVLPKAETEQTLVLAGLDDRAAVNAMTEATGLPHEVSSLAHLPASVAAVVDGLASAGTSATALRLEGPEVSIEKRRLDLIEHFTPLGFEFSTLAEAESKSLWDTLRDTAPLASPDAQIWRISSAPTNGAAIVETVRGLNVPIIAHFFDWAGGLIWLSVEPAANAHAGNIRQTVDTHGGHATLMRAEDDVRTTIPVFHPQPPALAALTKRVKDSFDPEHILNRGRMREDF